MAGRWLKIGFTGIPGYLGGMGFRVALDWRRYRGYRASPWEVFWNRIAIPALAGSSWVGL